jgi:hypothetical protein
MRAPILIVSETEAHASAVAIDGEELNAMPSSWLLLTVATLLEDGVAPTGLRLHKVAAPAMARGSDQTVLPLIGVKGSDASTARARVTTSLSTRVAAATSSSGRLSQIGAVVVAILACIAAVISRAAEVGRPSSSRPRRVSSLTSSAPLVRCARSATAAARPSPSTLPSSRSASRKVTH